jgi:hypothetical protein
MPAAARAASTTGRVERQLAGQHVVDHLAALTERGLDEPPELVLLVGRETVVRAVRLDDDHRRIHRGLRLERLGGTRNATRTRAWYCTKTDR